MPTLNKNHRARLRRVETKLDRALDSLNQATGELWPMELRTFHTAVQTATAQLAEAHKQVQAALVDGGPATASTADEDQVDLEDAIADQDQAQGEDPLTEPGRAEASRRRRS